MKSINKEDVELGTELFVKAEVVDKFTLNNGIDTALIFNIDDGNVYEDVNSESNWVPFKGGKCPVGQCNNVLVQFQDGKTDYGEAFEFTLHKGRTNLWPDNIIAYQIITPYISPRQKIIFKNKAEMLKDLISRGKLYINEEGNEHVYFSEDDRYTLGYVQEDGRSEVADEILDELEFWVK